MSTGAGSRVNRQGGMRRQTASLLPATAQQIRHAPLPCRVFEEAEALRAARRLQKGANGGVTVGFPQ